MWIFSFLIVISYHSYIVSDKDSTESPLFPDSGKGYLNHRVTSKQVTDNTLKHNWKKRKKETKPQKKYPGKVSFDLDRYREWDRDQDGHLWFVICSHTPTPGLDWYLKTRCNVFSFVPVHGLKKWILDLPGNMGRLLSHPVSDSVNILHRCTILVQGSVPVPVL